ncbi:hypothetical protein F0L74_00175 [Chitinophaga agrisoli]|uniref:Uncharacterized protein n=1 Tax=Chitinophaga agrisoli TaxID=2607653 RepID=A0A5B2W2H2_9BACT|nr:hypothetical protein [Chitinophaga agrisoli]KAA2244439.1 hypothetical protein F0L74_00175 [Chitinophaga agrisoli]
MSSNKEHNDKLARLIKENGLEQPSGQFSENLSYLIAMTYKKRRLPPYTAGKWLGKCILAVLVFFNMLLLYYLNPFAAQPVVTMAIAAFVIGIWILIAMMNRKTQGNTRSHSGLQHSLD